jgi:hypothetical protein
MLSSTQEIEEIPEEIKVIHIDPQDYDGTGAHVQILNEEGVEIMYDRISLPQEEITVDGEQVIYQVHFVVLRNHNFTEISTAQKNN